MSMPSNLAMMSSSCVECGWSVQCAEPGQATFLRFTALNTTANVDIVSVSAVADKRGPACDEVIERPGGKGSLDRVGYTFVGEGWTAGHGSGDFSAFADGVSGPTSAEACADSHLTRCATDLTTVTGATAAIWLISPSSTRRRAAGLDGRLHEPGRRRGRALRQRGGPADREGDGPGGGTAQAGSGLGPRREHDAVSSLLASRSDWATGLEAARDGRGVT